MGGKKESINNHIRKSYVFLFKASLERSYVGEEFYVTVHTTRGALKCIFSNIYKGKYLHGVIFRL